MRGYSAPRPIRDDDDLADFDSGDDSLDHYLRTRALVNHAEGASRCYVTCRTGRVVGFYALASAVVERLDPVPAILLSRLAVDRREQGKGLGRGLLRDAIIRSVRAADLIGVRALLVHAIDDKARKCYSDFGFLSFPTDRTHLLLSMKEARGIIRPTTPWPPPPPAR